jgi:hypothetical protein
VKGDCYVGIGGIVDHHCLINFLFFDDIGGIVDNLCLMNFLLFYVNNSSNINKVKESFNRDGKKFYQYQQT